MSEKQLKGKRILITGGAGFIGSSLTRRFCRNNEILIFDNFRRDALKYLSLPNQNKIHIIEGDIMNLGLLEATIKLFTPQIVLHLAAMAGVTDYYIQPVRTIEVNAIGTYNVLKAVASSKTERFVNFSTSEVYGPLVFGAREDSGTAQGELKQIRWSYGISKLAGECLTFSYAQEYKIPAVSIRPFNIYGPGQVGEGAIQIFVRKAIKGQTIQVTGDGNQIRAWCYIDDLVDCIEAILENKSTNGEIFNIGNPEGTITIRRLAETIISLSGSKSKIESVPHKGVDIDLRVPNIQKAESVVGFKPKVSLDDGLKRSIKWYKETNIDVPL